jgi:uncharacterized protein YebE (UPF0316 family)
MHEFWQIHGYSWVILPLGIFLARILDVSISTLRFMFLARGNRFLTVTIGFFEALIWIIIISQIIRNLDNVMCFIAYAAGFAAGTYVGMAIEERLALGKAVMRIITQKPADALVALLREKGYGVTSVAAEGAKGPVRLLFMVVNRTDIEGIAHQIKQLNPAAFYTVEDVRYVDQGVFPGVVNTRQRFLRSFGLKRRHP